MVVNGIDNDRDIFHKRGDVVIESAGRVWRVGWYWFVGSLQTEVTVKLSNRIIDDLEPLKDLLLIGIPTVWILMRGRRIVIDVVIFFGMRNCSNKLQNVPRVAS